MTEYNLEVERATENGMDRGTVPIPRPDKISDEAYRAVADNTAEVVRKLLTGKPGSLLRLSGTTIMVAPAGTNEHAICNAFLKESNRSREAFDWHTPNVITFE